MPAKLSWNEIRNRAIQFARNWETATDERAEAQTFWNEFFNVFGLTRRHVAAFEEPVKSIKGTYHRIDLFYKGKLLAEHKSAGQSLDKAGSQAFNYIQELIANGRGDEVPRYIVLSDFRRVVIYDLEPETQREFPEVRFEEEHSEERFEFPLEDFHRHVKHFAFLLGQTTHRFGEEDPANLEAAQIMADLHDAVEAGGYGTAAIERLLVRLLFCLFADDTGIFEPGQFQLYIENRCRADGSDLGIHLHSLFDVLNTEEAKRPKNLDEDLAAFPYINGELFAEPLPLSAFDRDMRNRLVAACRFDWTRISPAIFGSLFQGIMDSKERRQIGAHYTSERDILKLIRPLFLDVLREEFDAIRPLKMKNVRTERLRALQAKLAGLKFLDPACGCGNFLVIAYRELRRLELEILKLIYSGKHDQEELNLGEFYKLSKVDVDQFYGIEIGEWPARIAETALWLTDHQMNIELSIAFGNIFQRIPLKASPHIQCANALRMDWNDLLPASECSYVLGNPPFVGKQFQSQEQKTELKNIFGAITGLGTLDYVTAWYAKACGYIVNSTECAFVSTNSICQGEQVGVLWGHLAAKYSPKINFAHRTFAWQSEARGAAHVHVVIVGFGLLDRLEKSIFDYGDVRGEPQRAQASQINSYLIDAPNAILPNRTNTLCDSPELSFGSMPNDGGHLILSQSEFDQLTITSPELEDAIRPFIGAEEFIHGWLRYCIWLVSLSPNRFRGSKFLSDRLELVRAKRLASSRAQTRVLADSPGLFGEIRQPDRRYLAIPKTSSERRNYIPMGFLEKHIVASTELFTMSKATPYHFGVLTSAMHMAWVRQVCGRLESRYRYSAKLVYNNFPWPVEAVESQQAKVSACAQAVLDARQGYLDGGSTLADLYDPLLMPGDLLKAHQALDRAVDRCYRATPFNSERERVEYLFALYEKLTAPLAITAPPKKPRKPRAK
jgi:hypothetical protein